MAKIAKYNDFLIVERFDKNVKSELVKLGIKDKSEISKYLDIAKSGHLADYLSQKGDKFTFGLLNAIFKDAIAAKKRADLKVGAYKMLHRIVPITLAPYFPILAVIGYILGTSRAFNKIIIPVLSDPGLEYNSFLKKIIDTSIKISEGDIKVKDKFTRAFVVSDKLVSALKPDIVHKFSIELSKKMSLMNPDEVVPDHYIENELKTYINDNFEVDPKIPLKE